VESAEGGERWAKKHVADGYDIYELRTRVALRPTTERAAIIVDQMT